MQKIEDILRNLKKYPSAMSALALLVSIALLWPSIETVREITSHFLVFHLTGDEAVHSELIEVLSQTGKYRDWAGSPFALYLTTGPTVIVPGAILAAIFHISGALAGRFVVVFYALLLLSLLWKWFFASSGNVLAVAIGLGLFYAGWRANDSMVYYSYGIMGDGVGLFYVALSLFLLGRKQYFWSGVCASLASLSKPYMVLFPGVLVLSSIVEAGRGMGKWRTVLNSALGVLLPWVMWAGWMVAQEGWVTAFQLWISYPKLFASKVVADAGQSLGIFGRLEHSIANLCSLFRPRSAVIAMAGLVVAVKLGKVGRTILMFALIHLIWWLFLSDGNQMRYAAPTFFCGWLALGLYLVAVLTPVLKIEPVYTFSPLAIGGLFAFTILVAVIPPIAKWSQAGLNANTSPYLVQLQLGKYWRRNSASIPVLWSSNENPGEIDNEIVFCRPHTVRNFDPVSSTRKAGQPTADAVVLVTDYSKFGTMDWIARRKCSPMYVSARDLGFYRCP